jgi:energy-coupling factor transport system substrate-specific component
MAQESSQTRTPGRWDPLIGELHALRRRAGEPSFAELTRRIIEQRIERGQDEHAARIAKSSVHDAFRLGRSRINEALVRELVVVMDGDDEIVDQWLSRCEPSARPGAPARPDPDDEQAAVPPAPSVRQVLLLAIGCILLNLAGRVFVDFLHLPIYLDMVGTAIAAIALGPWRGAAVGATTNVVGVIGSGWVSLPFVLVNVVGALAWGYGVRRGGMGRTLPRFFLLNIATAVACSVVAVPILLALYGQDFRDGHDVITELVQESIGWFPLAASISNLMTSLADKLISGFVALVAVSALPLVMRQGFDLVVATDPPV